ncbi:amino acid transporter AVT6A-like [Silene latifolia]|uniref:amino acid transporter AVT6A-like n=1 Tax=Silene latifolia TaxID=37657 RepID=UPI003D782833
MSLIDLESQKSRLLSDTEGLEQTNERVPLLQAHSIILKTQDVNTASHITGVFNLTCSMIGAGIMGLPAAVKVLGVIPGVLMILVSGFLTKYSIEIMIRFSDHGRAYTYGQLMGDAFGRIGEVLLQICVIINNIGSTMIYLIIIGDVLSASTSNGIHHPGILEEWFGEHWWTGRVFVLIFLISFVLIPTSWVKRLESLKYTSGIAVGLTVYFILIVIGVTSYKLTMGTIQPPALFPTMDNLGSFLNLFSAVPVLVCAFICHFNVHAIQQELKDPSQMTGVVKSSISLCSMIYLMTGLFGFLIFGDSTASDILSNFDSDLGVPYSSVLNTMVRLSYAAYIILVFPVVFYPLRLNFDGLMFNKAIPLDSDDKRFAMTTLGLLLVIFVGAVSLPSIWVVFQFIGATVGALILFIFPASIVLRDRPKIATKEDKIYAWSLIFLAVFLDSIAIYNNVVSLI